MGELTDTEIDAAVERGRLAREREPRASAVRYDRRAGWVVVALTNGCIFSFPPTLPSELRARTEDQLARVEILAAGYGLHREALDADLSIPGLLAGLFGTRLQLAREAGRATSPTKAAASRANGAKGGRPRKSVRG